MLKQLVVGASLVLVAGAASSQDLVYSPFNPSFGGAAINSSHLLAIASAQRDATARDANVVFGGDLFGGDDPSSGNSDADLFVRQLEGRLLSALASQVTESIFGENPAEQGLVTFGTTTVEFERTIESIKLTILDTLDNTETIIEVPQLQIN